MNRLLITTLRGQRCAVLASDNRILQMNFEEESASEQIGTIYVGKVRNVVKNLNAAFVEYKPGVNGYYSLNDNKVHHFTDGSTSDRALKSGDEILVQISRAPVKTKDAVLSAELTLTGRYAAIMLSESRLGISAKIRDKKWREAFKINWAEHWNCSYAAVIRTNAYEVSFETVLEEANLLAEQLDKLCSDAAYRTSHSVMYCPDSFAVSVVQNLRAGEVNEVVTDLPDIYEELKQSGLCSAGDALKPALRFYDDSYPLTALYHLESSLERALGKQVWLKSGGYLVIEPTEAMTVIDVNTGKNVDKKSPEETYFKTNLEAASEIASQIRLRNLSGIILVDFIDMKEKKNNEELLSRFRQYLHTDPIKTVLVDMTALGLVEITRKKIKRPLMEQVINCSKK